MRSLVRTTYLTSGVTLLQQNNSYLWHKHWIFEKKNDLLTLFLYSTGTDILTPQIQKGKMTQIKISLWFLFFKYNQ